MDFDVKANNLLSGNMPELSQSSVSLDAVSGTYYLGEEQNEFTGDTYADALAALNTYTTDNATWLATYVDDPFAVVALKYEEDTKNYVSYMAYLEDTSEWYIVSSVIANDGDDAPDVLFQYSVTGNSDWTTTAVDDAVYWRVSTDNGLNWSAVTRWRGEDGNTPTFQFSANGYSGWHSSQVSTDQYWRWSLDGGTTWSSNYVRFTPETNVSSALPSPYTASVSTDGALEFFKDGTLIGAWDTDGLWVINQVTTGTGSFHLGEFLSIGSGVDQVSFVMEDTKTAYFPSWGSVSMDGNTSTVVTNRVHGDYTNIEPDGAVDTSTMLGFDFDVTSGLNECVLSFDFYPAESYTGTLTWRIKRSDLEVNFNQFDVTLTAGTLAHVQLHYPIWLKENEIANLSMVKDDTDEAILCYAGEDDAGTPYRKIYYRPFVDHESFDTSNIGVLLTLLNNTYTNHDGINWATLKDVPVATADTLGLIKVNTVALSVDEEGNLTLDQTQIDATKLANMSDFLSGGLNGTFDETAVVTDFQDWLPKSWGKFLPASIDTTMTLGGYALTYGDLIWASTDIPDGTTLDDDNFATYFSQVIVNEYAANPTENYSLLQGSEGGTKAWTAAPIINQLTPSSANTGTIGTETLPYATAYINTASFYNATQDLIASAIADTSRLTIQSEDGYGLAFYTNATNGLFVYNDGTNKISGETTVDALMTIDAITSVSANGTVGRYVGNAGNPFAFMTASKFNLITNAAGASVEGNLYMETDALYLSSIDKPIQFGTVATGVIAYPTDLIIGTETITVNKPINLTEKVTLGNIDDLEEYLSGSTGSATYLDVKAGFQSADHGGWILLDGRSVDDLTETQAARVSGLSWSVLPDATNRTLMGVGTTSLGGTGGSDTILRSALPNATISGTTGNNSVSHTHSVTSNFTTQSSGSHTHSLNGTALSFTGDSYKDTNGGDGDGSKITSTKSAGSHTHTISASSVSLGTQSANHTHSYSFYLNGNVTQTKTRPLHIGVNYFIYLGL